MPSCALAHRKRLEFVMMFLNCVFVGLGGLVGSVLRYLVSLIPLEHESGFPLVTLGINVLGAFLLGLVVAYAGKSASLDPRAAVSQGRRLRRVYDVFHICFGSARPAFRRKADRRATIHAPERRALRACGLWRGCARALNATSIRFIRLKAPDFLFIRVYTSFSCGIAKIYHFFTKFLLHGKKIACYTLPVMIR